MLFIFSTITFNLLIKVILNTLSDSSYISVISKSGSIDYFDSEMFCLTFLCLITFYHMWYFVMCDSSK